MTIFEIGKFHILFNFHNCVIQKFIEESVYHKKCQFCEFYTKMNKTRMKH